MSNHAIQRLGVGLTSLARRFVPDPFVLALALSAVVIGAGFANLMAGGESASFSAWAVLTGWAAGFSAPPLLAFAFQMALVLVTGHAVAASPPVQRWVAVVARLPGTSAGAAALVAFVACASALVHWGLGVTVGAFVAREMARAAEAEGRPFDYRLLGAAAYCGLAVWHGGLSGSAPLAVAVDGHAFSAALGGTVPIEATLFGTLNLVVTGVLVATIVALFWAMAPREPVLEGPRPPRLSTEPSGAVEAAPETDLAAAGFAERIRHAPWLCVGVGGIGVAAIAVGFVTDWVKLDLSSVILVFLFAGMMLQGTVANYVLAVADAARGAGAILLQFPFYFALVGVMKASGLIELSSEALASIATAETFPVFAFLAAGMVNFFVPSGGGQWAVQGDILGIAGGNLGVAPEVTVMAFAYGDAWTNMLQPFWALPILGITGLRARDIMGYAAMVFLLMGVLVPVLLLAMT